MMESAVQKRPKAFGGDEDARSCWPELETREEGASRASLGSGRATVLPGAETRKS